MTSFEEYFKESKKLKIKIGENELIIEGNIHDLSFSGNVVINGDVTSRFSCDGNVYITGEVNGTVIADGSVNIQGMYNGPIKSESYVTVNNEIVTI